VIYLDSSLLLEVYLGQSRAADARDLLRADPIHVSSRLLAIEVPVVLRRALAAAPDDRPLLDAAMQRFDADARAISFYDDIAAIAGRVRLDPRLAGCRSIDAAHVAAALLLQEELGARLIFGTLDVRMSEAARAVDLTVLPAPR